MKTCISCEKKLKFINTPLHGFKTSDGGRLCSKCTRLIGLRSGAEIMNLTRYIKKYNTKDFVEKLRELQNKNQNHPIQKLKKRISELNPSILNKPEINELATVLMKEESIEKIELGILQNGKGMSGSGLLVATNIRLIFIDKPTIGFGIKLEDFPYNKISSVSVETGLLKGNLKIICSGNEATINLFIKAKEFSEFIRQKTNQGVNPNRTSEFDILEKIEKISELKDKGILSQEEFESKKNELLARL